jgi:hypothetical protein
MMVLIKFFNKIRICEIVFSTILLLKNHLTHAKWHDLAIKLINIMKI